MTNKTAVRSTLAALACCSALGTAIAGSAQSGCDVVALNGSGTRLDNGVIVGRETLTIVATGKEIPVKFTAVPLGVTDFEEGQATFISSHDFVAENGREIQFTTFDKLRTVPLEDDPSCVIGACGLVFTLVLEKGVGDYTCGQIVSGYDPSTLASFTSTLQGNTLDLNSVGKLCKCRLSGNN